MERHLGVLSNVSHTFLLHKWQDLQYSNNLLTKVMAFFRIMKAPALRSESVEQGQEVVVVVLPRQVLGQVTTVVRKGLRPVLQVELRQLLLGAPSKSGYSS